MRRVLIGLTVVLAYVLVVGSPVHASREGTTTTTWSDDYEGPYCEGPPPSEDERPRCCCDGRQENTPTTRSKPTSTTTTVTTRGPEAAATTSTLPALIIHSDPPPPARKIDTDVSGVQIGQPAVLLPLPPAKPHPMRELPKTGPNQTTVLAGALLLIFGGACVAWGRPE